MALDDNTVRDGDAGFIGFASRLNPLTLPPGMLQESVNMRLDRGVAQTRKGAKRLADDINTGQDPLTLSFNLGSDVAVSSITASGLTNPATVTVDTAAAHGFSSGAQINIRGASDAAFNGDFTITVSDTDTFTYSTSSAPATTTPTGTVIANNGPEVRNTYTGGVFGAGTFASQNYDNGQEYIVICGSSSAFLWRDGASPVTKSYPSSPDETIEATDTVSTLQAFDRFYIFREADQSVTGWGKKTLNAATTVSGTVATVTSNAHGYTAGMRVRLEGGASAAFDGHEYGVKSTNLTTNTFEIDVPSGTANDTSATGRTVRRVKPPIYWDGGSGGFVRAAAGVPAGQPATYKTMRSVPWASYINNRVILPDGRDQVLISDVLDADIYDPFWQSFRAGAGGDDYIVAVHPWVDSTFLVFCRKSIWIGTIGQFPSADGAAFSIDTAVSKLELLTGEIGCSARNTIVTAGNFVFFLSDSGVYRLDARLDLKLRGDTRPLSDPVADLFETIDQSKVHRAFAIWHANRYLIALPTTAGVDDTNDLVVAWNALNESWEYKDQYSIGVDQLLVGSYGDQRRTFNVRRTGKLWLLDENSNGVDDNATAGITGTNVTARIKTRRYDFKELTSKRFLRSVTNAVIPAGGTIVTKVNIIDPDKPDQQIGSITNSGGSSEDYHLKAPIRFKAHAAELVYETTAARPEIRSAAIEAAPKSLPATLTRNES